MRILENLELCEINMQVLKGERNRNHVHTYIVQGRTEDYMIGGALTFPPAKCTR